MNTPLSPTLVAGVDSSTQSCKVVVVEAATGAVVRQGQASHPEGTEVDPAHWWTALQNAVEQAGGINDVAAISVAGQQHGLICLDADGAVIRPALLWNDTRSAEAATELVAELGAEFWALATGSVPVASFTISKLRWLADHEPAHAARIAAICLPHDWLTWQLAGGMARGLQALTTDRSDASGTGYFDSVANTYRRDLLARALRRPSVDEIVLPTVVAPAHPAGRTAAAGVVPAGITVAPGCGDNAGAALGLGLSPGHTSVSLGTSGVVAAVSKVPTHDPSGLVAGFADATGGWLPLACTLNGSRVLEATAALLNVDHDGFSALALAAPPGAGGLVEIPFLAGERTPNVPDATGSLTGLTIASMTRENLARAAVEGLLCLMSYGLESVRALGVPIEAVTLTGGGSRSAAVQHLAPGVLGVDVLLPDEGERVALGAARQAAWVLAAGDQPQSWPVAAQRIEGADQPDVRKQWQSALQLTYPQL